MGAEHSLSSQRGWGAADVAAFLAFASAAVSLFWALGGTWLLDTVGGEMERYARERSAGALALITVVVILKVVAGLLALALRAGARSRISRRFLLLSNGAASVILILWGGANVAAGGLVLADVVEPSATTDLHALHWHVFLWDLWFLVWGLALALALVASRRRSRSSASAPG